MKTLTLNLILTLICSVGFAQKQEAFRIDSLPKEGILLDKGWKWHAGDNLDFAKADFDDSKWENINPNFTIPELPNIDTKQPLWLRIKLNTTSKKAIAFSIKQSSASEIYLNGKLIKKYGELGQSGNGTSAYVPFDEYLVSNLDTLSNTLAIRIFFQEGIRYKQFQDIFYPLFICQVHSISQLPKYPHLDAYIGEGFNIGVPLILFLVYFTIFLFYKPNKSNLWFSLWGASNSITAFLALLAKLTTQISLQNTYTNWASIFSSFGTVCLIFSIYLLLNQKRIWPIIGFIILLTISTVNYFLPNNSDPRIFDFVILLFYIVLIVYMSVNAIKSGNKGGNYVIIGIIFFIVFWTIFIFDLLGFNKSTIIAGVNYHIAALSLPIIVATLLGLEFRNTNKSLLKNLEDVKVLSAEKQQILSTQNEMLEKQVEERTVELVNKNRELEIEGALDKIRSSSLAMRHSQEIQNVVIVLLEKLKELGLVFDSGAAIHIFTEGSKDAVIWVATANEISPTNKVNLPYDPEAFENNPIISDVWYAYETGTDIVNKVYSFEEKNKYFNYVFKHNGYDTIPEFVQNIILNVEGYTASFVSEKHSLLGAASWSGQVFSEMDFDILKRIARVFEQAYTRFLDLQKAEEQAREAQIEVALEKIRSRSLAMHHSNELNDVIAIMLDKMKELNVLLGTVALQFFDEKTKNSFLLIGSDLNEKPQMIYLPYDEKIFNEDTYLKDSWQAKISGESIINKKYSLEQKNKYFEYVFAKNDLTVVPQPVRDFILQTQSHITCLLIEKNSALFVDSWDGQVYNEEMLKVLKRASIVFEQAYVRFLDLQKAEAQAREAQIEAALERVRSRTMAMQKSDELGDASLLLDNQVRALGIRTRGCGFNIYGVNESTEWFSSEMGTMPTYKTPRENIFLNYYEAGQRGETLLINKFTTEECILHYEYLCSLPVTGEGLRQFKANGGSFPIQQIDHVAYFKYGYLLFITLESVPEAHDIFKRFAKVFEQTYTRFLDLQKAEAQAREALIEASLERIRSRAMAMNTSEEFNSLIGFIYLECTKLNMHLDRGFIMTFNKTTKDADWWMVGADASDKPLKILVEYHEYAPNLAIIKGWEEREQRWTYILEGNNKKTWDDYQFANALSQLPDVIIENMRSVESVILNASFQNFGCIMLSSFVPLTDDQFDLIQRFSKVFDQTYTRFLDLQKAETQAREAQIEASFERIRASALAMQTSNEFLGVVKTLYEQINALGQKELEATIIQFYDIEQGFINSWNAQNINKSSAGNITLGTAHIPFDACLLTLEWLKAYQSTQEDYTIVAKDDILKE